MDVLRYRPHVGAKIREVFMMTLVRRVVLFSIIISGSLSAGFDDEKPIFFGNLVWWLPDTMTEAEADSVAALKLAIVNAEVWAKNRSVLVRIKEKNPQILLFCLFSPAEVSSAGLLFKPLESALVRKVPSEFWLRDTGQQQIVSLSGNYVLNISQECPRVEGRTYGEFLADFLLKGVLADTIWNGLSFRDEWKRVPQAIVNTEIRYLVDANADGQPDAFDKFQNKWLGGVLDIVYKIHAAKGAKFKFQY